MNLIQLVTSLLLTALLSTSAQAGTVYATGQGVSRQTALSDALRQAISQGGGVEIRSATRVRNFEMVLDEIYSGTSGVVTGYEVLSETREDELFVIQVKAQVDPDSARNAFEAFEKRPSARKVFQQESFENRTVAVTYNHKRSDNLPARHKGVQALIDQIEDLLTEKGFDVILLNIARQNNARVHELLDIDSQIRATRESGADILVTVQMDAGVRTTEDGYKQVRADMTMKMFDASTGKLLGTVRQDGQALAYGGKYDLEDSLARIAVDKRAGRKASQRLLKKIVTRLSGPTTRNVYVHFTNVDGKTRRKIKKLLKRSLGWKVKTDLQAANSLTVRILDQRTDIVEETLEDEFDSADMRLELMTVKGSKLHFNGEYSENSY